jgi:hypothetical protein
MRTACFASPFLTLLLAACSGGVQSTAHGADGGGGDVVVTQGDGGGACRTAPPTVHRPSAGGTCPSHTSDAGADAGMTGCMPPHDACLVDSDCGATGVCECQQPRCTFPFPAYGNVCVPGDCRIDSDCACGYCAADISCGGTNAYHCTTPHDECSTDGDCQDGSSFTQCRWSTDRWACVQGMGCPG